jgi:hypothetical protein
MVLVSVGWCIAICKTQATLHQSRETTDVWFQVIEFKEKIFGVADELVRGSG